MPNITIYINDELYTKWVLFDEFKKQKLKEQILKLIENILIPSLHASSNTSGERQVDSRHNDSTTPNLSILNTTKDEDEEFDYVYREESK